MSRRGGFTPPLHSRALSRFSSPDSGDFRRHVVIDPARILCVAGYFRCIGVVPVQVFPATFPVAPVSVVSSSVHHPSFWRYWLQVIPNAPTYFTVEEDSSIKKDESRSMKYEFHHMFSYYRYEILGYGGFGLSALLLLYLIWVLPSDRLEKRLRRNYRPRRVREGTKHVSQKLRNRLR